LRDKLHREILTAPKGKKGKEGEKGRGGEVSAIEGRGEGMEELKEGKRRGHGKRPTI